MKRQWKRIQFYFKAATLKRLFTKHNETPMKSAMAIALGVFIGILPLWGVMLLLGILSAHLLKLNKPLVLLATNIHFTPLYPLIAFFCLKLGFHITGSDLGFPTMNEINFEVLRSFFWFYVIGSVPIALITSSIFGFTTFATIHLVRFYRVSGKVPQKIPIGKHI